MIKFTPMRIHPLQLLAICFIVGGLSCLLGFFLGYQHFVTLLE